MSFKRIQPLLGFFGLLALLGLPACAEPGPDIDRTQTNLVDKSIFEGEWWYTRTVADIHDDAAWAIAYAGVGAPWPGAMANFDIASQSGVAGRIRWVIDQNFLYAYRSTEIIQGAAEDANSGEYLGQPLAIFPIESHLDVRRQYSAATGEPTNVLAESTDRRWYDRQFIRVDWSQNLVTFGLFGESLQIDELFGGFRREPAANFVQEGGDSRIPDSWRPQFVRIGEDPDYRFAAEWPAEMADTVHYMSFVTNELWTPNFCGGATCETSIRISVRSAFLRVPPNHEYAAETLPHSEYDRFGIIRTESRTFISGGRDRSELGQYCDARCVAACQFDDDCGDGGVCELGPDGNNGSCVAGRAEDIDDCGAGTVCTYAPGGGTCEGSVDADCGPGFCNTETNICEGGLSSHRGETDFLTFYRLRHNFYSDSLAPAEDPRHGANGQCLADWQCDNRHGTVDVGAIDGAPWVVGLEAAVAESRGVESVDITGTALTSGSTCDPAANRCTIPLRWRPVRQVSYHLSPQYPRSLVHSAFEVVSEWNDSFMQANRELIGQPLPSGAPVSCQSADPTQYCFCGEVTAPEVRSDMTCAHRSNLFVPPAERGEENPYDCWVGVRGDDGTVTRNDAVDPANPTSYDDYTNDVYRYAFEGRECMLVLKVNSCDRPVAEGEQPAACEELGDIRHQFFNYATGAGAGWCGVMQPVQDPTNGEALTIPINMGGLCLDNAASIALYLWPVLRGEISEDVYFNSEHTRAYFENAGNIHSPVGFAPTIEGTEYIPEDLSRPSLQATIPVDMNTQLNEIFAQNAGRFEQLRNGNEGRAQILSDRLGLLAGTSQERRLVEGMRLEGPTAVASQLPLEGAQLAHAGLNTAGSEAVMNRVSPFRDQFQETITSDHLRETALANNYIYYPREALFTYRYNQYWANAFAGRPNEEGQIRWRQAFHKAVMLHELGHGLGLEHNFAGSYDRDHYQDGYFNRATERDENGRHINALPTLAEFDCGNDGLCPNDAGYTAPDQGERDSQLTDLESVAWTEALRSVRTRRSLSGMGNTMTSSLMDYNGDLSDMSGLGRYDRAAVFFNYFNMVEAYEGDPTYREGVGTSLDGVLRSDATPRTLWTWYRGGESCDVNTDCPYAEGAPALTGDQGIYQRCVRNPRYSQIPVPCDGDRNCICSNFDEDFIDFTEGAAYTPDRNDDGVPDFARVDYMFCSNSRLGDISWCNVFDAGESFQETIDHFRQVWQEGYARNYFRNFRRGFSTGSRATRYIVDAAKMFQHLFFRYFFEPEFRQQTGPLGFNDQYLASVDAMNWLAELAQLPDVGSYRLEQVAGPDSCDPRDHTNPGNPAECQYAYRHLGEELDMDGSDFSLGVGQGYHTWSQYQDGLYGFFRLERAGVFWDKLIALRALTTRDWGLNFTIDERYLINFYDLFPIEMTELFGGYVINDDHWIAPRVSMASGEPQITYLNYLRGSCSDPTTGERGPCRPSNEEIFTDPPLMDTSNEILRLYAAIFALAEFPVYYDPSFESRLAVFRLDSADGFTIPEVQLDGQPTQAFGAAVPDSGHAVTTDPADADYMIYVSDRLHTPYVAVKVRERLTFNLEEEQLGFQLLLRLHEQQERVRELEGLAAPSQAERRELTNLRRELQKGESFVEALIEVQNIFGITSF